MAAQNNRGGEWPGDVEARWRERRARTRVIREVTAEVGASSAGQNTEQVRERLAAGFRTRGLEPAPTESALAAMADAILLGDGWAGQVRRTALGVRMLAGLGHAAVRQARERVQARGPNMVLDKDPIIIDADRAQPAITVTLDPGAQEWLTQSGDAEVRPTSEIFVLLGTAGPDTEDERARVAVFATGHRMGVLDQASSAAYLPAIRAGQREDKPVVIEAILSRDAASGSRLELYRPRTEQP